MLPIEYNRIPACIRAYLYIIRTNSHNSPADRASINLKIGMYLILDSKEIHQKKFLDTLSARELWATSVPNQGQIGAQQRQRQSH